MDTWLLRWGIKAKGDVLETNLTSQLTIEGKKELYLSVKSSSAEALIGDIGCYFAANKQEQWQNNRP